MYLQEKHKQFAFKSYAKFMTNKQVAQAFIKEFPCMSGVSPSKLLISIVWLVSPCLYLTLTHRSVRLSHPSYLYFPFISDRETPSYDCNVL